MWGEVPGNKRKERKGEREKKDHRYDYIRTDNVCVPKLRTQSIPVYNKCQQLRYRKSFCNVHIYVGRQSEDSYTAEHGKLRRERSGVD